MRFPPFFSGNFVSAKYNLSGSYIPSFQKKEVGSVGQRIQLAPLAGQHTSEDLFHLYEANKLTLGWYIQWSGVTWNLKYELLLSEDKQCTNVKIYLQCNCSVAKNAALPLIKKSPNPNIKLIQKIIPSWYSQVLLLLSWLPSFLLASFLLLTPKLSLTMTMFFLFLHAFSQSFFFSW